MESVARAICAAQDLTFHCHVGEGAFKETFQVSNDGVASALKVHRADVSVERASREIDAMTRCNHPNIARVSRIDQHTIGTESFLYSLEEFVGGGSLAARLAAQGLYAPTNIQRLGTLLIDAVSHIAARGLVHRDLKPENVMLREDGETPVLVDFGLVRDLSAPSITPSWAIHGPGTPRYAPPEQLLNEKALIDWRSDQFSLGVMLSYAVFNFHPYGGASESAVELVTRVSQRNGPTSRFRDSAHDAGLTSLPKMVSGWPVGRFRRPENLARAWASQERRS
ncbi:MAG: serine/threonine-protein kinase [Bryobacterales bacterium]|nr:serine/threonine-protein kinase [Bryobacterales bacterium]